LIGFSENKVSRCGVRASAQGGFHRLPRTTSQRGTFFMRAALGVLEVTTMGFSTTVPRFGFQPTLCLARPMLLEALDCYERGDYIGAGVRLRESVTRFLTAAVEWYAVELPERSKRHKYPRSADLARALHKAKQLDGWGLASILEMLAVGNAAAHCKPFHPKSLRGAMAILFAQIDSEPYSALKERRPAVASTFDENADYDLDDCDDDDGADWWKSEGGAV